MTDQNVTLTIPERLPADITINLCALRPNTTIEVIFENNTIRYTSEMFEKALKLAFEATKIKWALPEPQGKPGDILCHENGEYMWLTEEEADKRGMKKCEWDNGFLYRTDLF